MDRKEILDNGKLIRVAYGIAKCFEWKVIDYNKKRYQVSMFNKEVKEVKRTYCDICGKASYRPKCCGYYKG